MIRDLAATIRFDDGDVRRIKQQVLGFACDALCEHGRVLDDPEFVLRVFVASVGERAHLGPRGFVLNATERPNFHGELKRPDNVYVIGQILIQRVELRL